VINGRFYLIAPHVLVYDPATNKWTTKGPLPGDLTGASVALLSHLYLFGADTRTGGSIPGIFIYDPVSDTWETKPLLTKFAWFEPSELAAARVFLNGQPRVEVVGGLRDWPGSPGNNQQYIP
jgi:N-acetylneuraminic acid mutarotase